MSNLGMYQEIVEMAHEAGGVDQLLMKVESRGAKKVLIALVAAGSLAYLLNKNHSSETGSIVKKVKKTVAGNNIRLLKSYR